MPTAPLGSPIIVGKTPSVFLHGTALAGHVPISATIGSQAPFPWRLWLYAIVMTGAAGAGGYSTYRYRAEAIATRNVLLSTTAKLIA